MKRSATGAILLALLLSGCGSIVCDPIAVEVPLTVEIVAYQFDGLKSWGTDRDGREVEWRNDILRFRVIDPVEFSGREWEIMLPSAFEEDRLHVVPKVGSRRVIVIDSNSLAVLQAIDRKEIQKISPPLLGFEYVFPELRE